MTGNFILSDECQSPSVSKNQEIPYRQFLLFCLKARIYYLRLYLTHIWWRSFTMESNLHFKIITKNRVTSAVGVLVHTERVITNIEKFTFKNFC